MPFATVETHRIQQAIALLLTTVLTSCIHSPANSNRSDTTEAAILTVAAAASLQNALSTIDPLFAEAHPNIEIFYSSGGSGTLQRQIEQGAPVDVFLSAGPEQMDAIAQKHLIQPESRQDILSNHLVLIAPPNSKLERFEDLASFVDRQKKLAVGEFRSVPAGQYAQETLNQLGLLPQLNSQLVFFSSVRGVLAAVESGNVSAGLVYQTDAELSDRIEVIEIARDRIQPSIRYPIAILERSSHPDAAQQYVDFLKTPAATEIFQQFGFIQPATQTKRPHP